MTLRRPVKLLVFLELLLLVVSCGGNDLLPFGLPPLIEAGDQLSDFGTTPAVTIALVHSVGAGWVVVFDDAGGGTPGTMHGKSHVDPGTTASGVSVTLDTALTENQSLVAVLYSDADPEGVYGAEDMPQTSGGNDVTTVFQVTLPAVVAGDQTLSDLTTIVTVTTARSYGAGWVTIHPDNTGNPDLGTVLGMLLLPDGTSTNLQVQLDTPTTNAQVLHAVLWKNAAPTGTFGGSDAVVQDNSAMDVTAMFTATVPAGTPDVRLRFVTFEFADFVLTQVKPNLWADTVVADPGTQIGEPGGNDVTITLLVGIRYEIENNQGGADPFEFMDQNAAGVPASDVVQLSPAVSGALNADPDINWQKISDSVSRFTVDADFKTNVHGYRSATNLNTMRGTVNVP